MGFSTQMEHDGSVPTMRTAANACLLTDTAAHTFCKWVSLGPCCGICGATGSGKDFSRWLQCSGAGTRCMFTSQKQLGSRLLQSAGSCWGALWQHLSLGLPRRKAPDSACRWKALPQGLQSRGLLIPAPGMRSQLGYVIRFWTSS